jgi:hypothetical protein
LNGGVISAAPTASASSWIVHKWNAVYVSGERTIVSQIP